MWNKLLFVGISPLDFEGSVAYFDLKPRFEFGQWPTTVKPFEIYASNLFARVEEVSRIVQVIIITILKQ